MISPDDLLWTKEDVASYLHYKPRTLERVGNLPGFPKPARHGHQKCWRAGDIIDWVRRNGQPPPVKCRPLLRSNSCECKKVVKR
jgi:hypothetical protein